jgi:hypothetical protein
MTLRPAFRSPAHALSYVLFSTTCLALPLVLAVAGRPTRSDVYRSIRPTSGAYAYIERETLEERSDIDMVFVGASHIWEGIDTPMVQRELSSALGRPATARTLGFSWPGLDVTYAVLLDLFAHRHVRTVVLELPRADYDRDKPHPMAYRLLDYAHHGDVLGDLSWKHRAELYGDFVLAAPRHLLSFLRSNPPDPSVEFVATLGSADRTFDVDGSTFETSAFEPPQLSAERTIFSPSSAHYFSFAGKPLTDYDAVFARRILELVARSGAKVIALHLPIWAERRAPVVEEREPWPDVLALPLVGVAPSVLFSGLSDVQLARMFVDVGHLNRNGARVFTRAILPALLKLHASN